MDKKNIDESNQIYDRWAKLNGWKTGPIASRPEAQQKAMRWRGYLTDQFDINVPLSAITEEQFNIICEHFNLTQDQKRELVKYYSDAFPDEQIDFSLLGPLNIRP